MVVRVSDQALLRLLELVREKLGALDARVEIGGQPPSDDRQLWIELPGGRRVVVLFGEPVDQAARKLEQLETILGSFAGIAQGRVEGAEQASLVSVRAALDDELGRLSTRAGAIQAVVVDAGSPVLWGSSHGGEPVVEVDPKLLRRRAQLFEEAEQEGLDVATLLARGPVDSTDRGAWPTINAVAGLDAELSRLHQRHAAFDAAAWKRFVLTSRAVAAVRQHVPRAPATAGPLRATMQGRGLGYFVRSFGGIYFLVLVYEGPFSELRTQRAVGQVLARIERLVLKLPPVDPRPGAKVVRLKR